MPISFNPVFIISVYSSYIHLYFFLSIFLYISLSMQIDAYLFLSLFQFKFTAISFKPIFFTLVYFSISIYICFHFLSINLYFFISLCQSSLMPIFFYLFVNPNSPLSLSITFSLSLSILCISNYICFHLLSIDLYFFISLFQSGLMLISFNPCPSS